MHEGYTEKEAKEIEKKLEMMGWEIDVDNLSEVPHNDSVWWYEYDLYAPILSVRKPGKNVYYYLIADGDISIRNPKNEDEYFKFRGGEPEGELTNDLIKYGEWEDSNWFEVVKVVRGKDRANINIDREFSETHDTMTYYIRDAVEKFIEVLKQER